MDREGRGEGKEGEGPEMGWKGWVDPVSTWLAVGGTMSVPRGPLKALAGGWGDSSSGEVGGGGR